MPISLVRSVTDTSMIFITPIPPTKREIPQQRNKCGDHSKHLVHGFHDILEALYLEIIVSGTLMASLQKIYDLICHHLGIQIFICLDCDLIKLTGTSL